MIAPFTFQQEPRVPLLVPQRVPQKLPVDIVPDLVAECVIPGSVVGIGDEEDPSTLRWLD